VDIANSPIRTGSLQGELMHPALDIHGSGQTCYAEMVFPDYANHYGKLFGGTALSLMGKARSWPQTGMRAAQSSWRAPTRSTFIRLSPSGQLVELSVHVARVCRTSMMVAVDAAGFPITIKSPLSI
jgi:acyl-CoA hydrolase